MKSASVLSLSLILLCALSASAVETVSLPRGVRADAPMTAPAAGVPAISIVSPALGRVEELTPAALPSLEQAALAAPAAASGAAPESARPASARENVAAQVGEMTAAVAQTVGPAGALSGAGVETANALGRAAQDVLEGRSGASVSGVLAGPSSARFAALRPAARRASSRALAVAASAGAALAASAVPAFAAVDPVSGVMAPASFIGIVLGGFVALTIGFSGKDDIVSWVQKAAAYVISFGATGAAIGGVAYTFDQRSAVLATVGVAVAGLVSAVVALSRWHDSNLDDAYEALTKAMTMAWSFGAIGAALGFVGLLGGAELAHPAALGVTAGGLLALLVGVNAPQEEYGWYKKALAYVGVFGLGGLIVGAFSFWFGATAAMLTGAGFAAGAAFAMIGGWWQWLQSKPAAAFQWLDRAAVYMLTFGVFGLALGGIESFGGAALAWPAGIGAALAALAAMTLRSGHLTSDVVEQQQAWLKQAALLTGFFGAVGFALGLLAQIGGLVGRRAALPALHLPALPALPTLNLGPLAFLLDGWLLWPAAGGLAFGALLALLLGREELRRATAAGTRRAWLRKAAKLTAVTGTLGLTLGAVLMMVRPFLF